MTKRHYFNDLGACRATPRGRADRGESDRSSDRTVRRSRKMLPVLLDGAGERQALRLMEGGEVSIELLTALDVQPHLGFLPGWGALRE